MKDSTVKPQARRVGNLRYILLALWRMALPRRVRRMQRSMLLRGWETRPDADEIRRRVAFYCQVPEGTVLGETSVKGCDIRLGVEGYGSKYVFDLQQFLRAWPGDSRLCFFSGDTYGNPTVPTVIKTRRIDSLAPLSTILNLDRRRHFLKVVDPIPFMEKKDLLLFRGAISHKPRRIKMMERWADAPFADFGDTSTDERSRWSTEPISIEEHFLYRYILCLEGNDVCSALQWVMASGCVPVMTRPTVEGWLMHSQLVAGEHYVEIAADYSDLGEKMEWLRTHPEEGERISEASRRWAKRFDDPKREKIISHLVLEEYFRRTRE